MNSVNKRMLLFLLLCIVVVFLISYCLFYVSRDSRRGNIIPLQSALGNPVLLDFNSPTVTPTPTTSPTPTPTSTPSPTPSPTPYPVSYQQLDDWFTKYANHYSVDKSLLWYIASCETGFRPNATNWIYGGIFQFSPNTWTANRKVMGLDPNPDLRFNPEESIRTAAFLLSTRGPSAWPNCSKR